jgi:hypothetical protein
VGDRVWNSGSQQKAKRAVRRSNFPHYDEGLVETMLDEDWFDIEDFTEAVSIVQKRMQETPQIFRKKSDT